MLSLLETPVSSEGTIQVLLHKTAGTLVAEMFGGSDFWLKMGRHVEFKSVFIKVKSKQRSKETSVH